MRDHDDDPIEHLEEEDFRALDKQAESIALDSGLDRLRDSEIDRLHAAIARALATAWLAGRQRGRDEGPTPLEVGP